MKTLHQIIEEKTPKFPLRAIIDTIRGVHVDLRLIGVIGLRDSPHPVEIEVYPDDLESYAAIVWYPKRSN